MILFHNLSQAARSDTEKSFDTKVTLLIFSTPRFFRMTMYLFLIRLLAPLSDFYLRFCYSVIKFHSYEFADSMLTLRARGPRYENPISKTTLIPSFN